MNRIKNIIDRREFIRISKRIPVQLTLDNECEEKEIFNVISKDISIGGMCIDFPYKKLPFSKRYISLSINLPEEKTLIKLTAEIVWSKRKPRLSSGYNLGTRFINLDEQIKNKLSSYIQQSPIVDKSGISRWVEDFIYKGIIKNILLLSKLGKNSIRGLADSGLNFDHMYENKAEGRFVLGKLIDKTLLNLPAVKSTRNRKTNILKILYNEVENNILLGKKTRILDLASGPSRYLNELISKENKDYIEALCLDQDFSSLDKGKSLASGKPIRYMRANALRLNHLINFSKKVSWKPNVVIVSGLYVYLEDELVNKSLKDIFECLENDGLVIFCSQQDNPSKKLMAKVCTTQSGNSWRLFYRSPKQLRKLMIMIGYKYNIISLDSLGMYELCTGRKV